MIDPAPRSGFTLVEVLVSITVLALLGTGAMTLYRNSMYSYRLTSWKQDRTRQAELFWNRLRKPIEEASDALERQDLGLGKWTIAKTSRPLKFNPAGGPGKILAWQIDHYDSVSGLVNGPATWLLERSGRELRLNGPNTPNLLVLDDVDTVTIQATQIVQKAGTFEEELDLSGVSPDDVTGSILEISIILTPPPSLPAPAVRLIQNAKFKLVVEAQSTPSPSY